MKQVKLPLFSADANVVEGRDSGNFSAQDQQDSVGNAGSGKLLSNVPEVGNFGGMSLVEELELAEQHQKMKEELDKAQLEQHQQQNIVEEPELAVQHQQQNNNNSHIPHGAPPRHFLLSLLILFFFVLIVLVVLRVQRGQLVIRISVFFPSAMKLTENVLQSKDVGMEQQHLQEQLVAALNERAEQLELELKETHIKFEQQLEELETI
uniref:Transmembrane protein n=1 Tax=Globodera pallida TaxID=36090 RepID=A0A183CFX7_GLOPA